MKKTRNPMTRRTLTAALFLATLIGFSALCICSAETFGDLTYAVSNGEVTILSCDDDAVYVDIPSTLNGYPVTGIGDNAFEWCSDLTGVTIPSSVKRIGDSAFCDCHSLTGVVIPDSVVSIGNCAFRWCNSLTSINIPYGVTAIGASAFERCDSLKGINLPGSVVSIGDGAFRWCESLAGISLPESVTSIGVQAFFGCSGLTSITLPDGLTSIGAFAFDGCSGLTSITLPESLVSIGGFAFDGCKDLTIYGVSGSYAQTYAEENDIQFTPIESLPENPVSGITASLPTFPVTLNGLTNSNDYSRYPLLVFNDITYFPMTYYDCRLLGLTTDWTPETGLAISKSDEVLPEYVHDVQDAANPNTVDVQLATGAISVNGKAVDNSREEYPLLFFRDVTYFPLTWRFAVDEFGWSYSFDAVNGLVISSN